MEGSWEASGNCAGDPLEQNPPILYDKHFACANVVLLAILGPGEYRPDSSPTLPYSEAYVVAPHGVAIRRSPTQFDSIEEFESASRQAPGLDSASAVPIILCLVTISIGNSGCLDSGDTKC